MEISEFGSGPALVLLPGLDGRREFVRPAADALARSFRVLALSLCGEPGSGERFDPALGFENYTRQVLSVLDRLRLDRAIVCGISFGGRAAIRFAAVHPDRTAALIVASTPGPNFHLRPRHRLYLRTPYLFGPLFFVESPQRLRPELAATFPDLQRRLRFTRQQLARFLSAPLSPSRMAARARLVDATSVEADCASISAPTLIVTGEPALDRVVNVADTSTYTARIAGSQHRILATTGHLGPITRPDAFAAIVRDFVDSCGSHMTAGRQSDRATA
jgi:pimeloyl-ACP methyl ester carboxylesterase